MNIDWFTVIAQAVNFLILVWLMKRFLYKPITKAIAAREKRIDEKLADVDAKEKQAQKERKEFQQKNDEFDKQRDTMMSKATEEVKTERKRLLEEARQAADELSAKRQETLKNEAQKLKNAITTRTQQEVFAIARKTLADLGSASLEASITEAFIHRLEELKDKDKEEISKALKAPPDSVIVRSVFDLPAPQRTAIQKALDTAFSTKDQIRFETAPELISGIEFSVDGYKVAWSIDDYLTSVEKSVGVLLKEQVKPVAKTDSKPDKPQPALEGAVVNDD